MRIRHGRRSNQRRRAVLVVLAVALVVSACTGESDQPPTPLVPGTESRPREVNLIARDYAFVPPTLELIPGETILLHVVNAGLVVHEAVIGDAAVQDAWETAEAAVAGAPPGPTPQVSVPPQLAGIRVVVRSGERVDVTFTVPTPPGGDGPVDEATPGLVPGVTRSTVDRDGPVWIVGCHIPGHFAKGMQVPVRWIAPTATRGAIGRLAVRAP